MNSESIIKNMIKNIHNYHKTPKFILLFYLPSQNDHDTDLYFSMCAAERQPTPYEHNKILHSLKQELGNIVFASDYSIIKFENILNYLNQLI